MAQLRRMGLFMKQLRRQVAAGDQAGSTATITAIDARLQEESWRIRCWSTGMGTAVRDFERRRNALRLADMYGKALPDAYKEKRARQLLEAALAAADDTLTWEDVEDVVSAQG